MMVVSFASRLILTYFSLLASLNRGTTFEPKSRLIDGFGFLMLHPDLEDLFRSLHLLGFQEDWVDEWVD